MNALHDLGLLLTLSDVAELPHCSRAHESQRCCPLVWTCSRAPLCGSAFQKYGERVFGAAAGMMERDAVVYVRTDRREFTYQTTVEVLREAFPSKKLFRRLRPVQGPTQRQLFGNRTSQPGEVDLVLLP